MQSTIFYQINFNCTCTTRTTSYLSVVPNFSKFLTVWMKRNKLEIFARNWDNFLCDLVKITCCLFSLSTFAWMRLKSASDCRTSVSCLVKRLQSTRDKSKNGHQTCEKLIFSLLNKEIHVSSILWGPWQRKWIC